MTVPAPRTTTLELERHLAAPPERVWRAWTDPARLARWFAPSADLPTEAEMDARAGGRWRVRMGDWEVAGEVLEARPTDLLELEFRWSHDAARPSRVRVELEPAGTGTRLRLVHDRNPDAEAAASHRDGWTRNLARLAALVEADAA